MVNASHVKSSDKDTENTSTAAGNKVEKRGTLY